MIWRKIALLLILLLCLAALGLTLSITREPWSLDELLQIWPMLLLIIAPYFALTPLALWLAPGKIEQVMLCISVLAIGLWGIMTLYDNLYLEPERSPEMIVFIGFMTVPIVFVQLWATATVGCIFALIRVVKILKTRKGPK